MQLNQIKTNGTILAELKSNKQVINNLDDMLDIIGNSSYQEMYSVITYKHQFNPDFFELRTGFAGEVLQKFSNYQMRLAIIGDFTNIDSKSLRDFIYESNKNGKIIFVKTIEEAKIMFSK